MPTALRTILAATALAITAGTASAATPAVIVNPPAAEAIADPAIMPALFGVKICGLWHWGLHYHKRHGWHFGRFRLCI
jgi:hypothetical protein